MSILSIARGGWLNGYSNFGNQQTLSTTTGKKNNLTRAAILGKVYKFGSKVMRVTNTAVAFIKKHPKTITTTIGITTLVVGAAMANPALACTGIGAIISAIMYVPPTTAARQLKKPWPPAYNQNRDYGIAVTRGMPCCGHYGTLRRGGY